jgi:carbamoyl-phosphate synthase small subunit
LLEDGTRLNGEACGALCNATGEVVFTTSMSGYQETVTDPSYANQLVTFTYPHIGNYGVSERAQESGRVHARAVIMRSATNHCKQPGSGWLDWLQANNIPAITGIDTRALVRHIRDQGAMRGGVFTDNTSEREARELIAGEPPMAGLDLAKEVSPSSRSIVGKGNPGPHIVAIDTGIKRSIVDKLVARGAVVELHRADADAQTLLASKPDAILLANGPGDPAALGYIVATLRELIGRKPIFGICLGHQLLCQAVGLKTYKLRFGHRGANHPVKDLTTGEIEITSQNHGFAVLGPNGEHTVLGDEPLRWQTQFGRAELTHLNLYDRTVEGLRLDEVAARTVQYHPEAGPGPHDSLHLFDNFIAELGY